MNENWIVSISVEVIFIYLPNSWMRYHIMFKNLVIYVPDATFARFRKLRDSESMSLPAGLTL